MTTGRIRVVLADDHRMVREALAGVLNDHPGIDVVGQAGDGDEAARIIDLEKPDVAVLDYSMPPRDAPPLVESLVQRHASMRILVLTIHESLHYAVRVLEAGADGYVIKSSAASELFEAIRAVDQGEVYVSPRVSHQVLKALRNPRSMRVGLDALSPREFDLLRILGAGMGLGECADRLNISTSTASTYRARLMDKLKLRSTAELIRYALEHDIVG